MLEKEVSQLLISLNRSFIMEMRQRFKGSDMEITWVQFLALKIVSLSEACTPLLLADSLLKDKTQITRLTKELISLELLEKRPNPADKRSQILVLTKRGHGHLTRMVKIEEGFVKEMITHCEREAVHDWVETTRKMLGHLHDTKAGKDAS